ncbi:PqqD family protein [uncultured Desulfobacter sp.]|uniref:PqqD family protein n=1 Tax=uncultured Desulfobacter sp. TaxID=240139 RepID=UPI002AAA78E3|nr:PqqD family protein [uncultured Desulfobacter sp.]
MTYEISPQDKFNPVDEVTWRDINGEVVALKLVSGEYYSFNEVGRLSWLSITEGKQVSQIVDHIVENYETTLEQAWKDLNEFITGLMEHKLLVKGE